MALDLIEAEDAYFSSNGGEDQEAKLQALWGAYERLNTTDRDSVDTFLESLRALPKERTHGKQK